MKVKFRRFVKALPIYRLGVLHTYPNNFPVINAERIVATLELFNRGFTIDRLFCRKGLVEL